MIELKNIKKIYNKGENEVVALGGISLKIEEGEFLSVMGASGSGKTTLLNVLGGMDRMDDGEYLFKGERIDQMNNKKLDVFRSKKIGFVFQQFMLLPDYTVFENVEIPLRAQNVKKSKRRHLIMDLLKELGMEGYEKKYPKQLSGGQQQRCAIARALVTKPDLILADEPTGALDRKTGQEIMNLLKKLNKQGKTVVIVTHDPTIAEQTNRVIMVEDGLVV